ncbi:MAG: inositol monophosphatase family protein [bacterium]
MIASKSGQGNGNEAGAAGASLGDRRALLATCVAAAARSAEVIREGAMRRSTLTWESKSTFDFVSDVDRASEAALTAVIAARHPDATLLAEEGSPEADATRGLVFVADPLDGTTNFLHGVPWYAVSIAALVDGAVVAGAIINAATGELFTATLGGGARRAGEAMRVSSTTEPHRALLATGFPFSREEEIERYIPLLPALMRATSGLRRNGAAALDLADVACGRYDAFFELRLLPWDLAAGVLMVREAGGLATTMDGAPCPIAETSMLAANPTMHAWMLSTLHR